MSIEGRERNLELVNELALKLRNWGKWGAEDEVGAPNYVTAEHIIRAASLVKKGAVFSLALPLDKNGPMQGRYSGRFNPIHTMLQDGGDIALGAQDHYLNRFTDDIVTMTLQASTQWDALSHIYHDGQMYNGFGLEQVTSSGAHRNDIDNQKDKMVGRGVLLDLPKYKGVPWLEESYVIEAEDLEGCARAQGVEIGEGDFLLVRTGILKHVRERGFWGEYEAGPAAGLGLSTAEYLWERKVASVATDTWGVEPQPNETTDVFQPLHIVLLVNAGLLFGEMFDLEELSVDCAADGVYDFLLVAAPLRFTGAVGSPLNPQAIK